MGVASPDSSQNTFHKRRGSGGDSILSLWPAKFEMEAKGTLEPVDRRDVFAGIDGVVQDLKVNHGDQVEADQLLVSTPQHEIGNRYRHRGG